jgi:hypothetical protein
MAKRTFRWSPEKREMVEILPYEADGGHFVFGDTPRFVSPLDGSVIEGRKQYEDHCKRHNVVPTAELKGLQRGPSMVDKQRERQQLREQLWELTDRSMRGRRCRD